MNNITIETLTPVHIGSGRTLMKNMDFFHFPNIGNRPIAIIDEKKILELIGKSNLPQWMQCIEKRQDLRQQFQVLKNIEPSQIAKRIIPLSENPNKYELYEHIHNASAKPYLPGSSIKGAIRTGIIAYLIKQEKKICSKQK